MPPLCQRRNEGVRQLRAAAERNRLDLESEARSPADLNTVYYSTTQTNAPFPPFGTILTELNIEIDLGTPGWSERSLALRRSSLVDRNPEGTDNALTSSKRPSGDPCCLEYPGGRVTPSA
ncbi:MAG: hypothetical protein ACI9K5_000046 [Gammaproteobacteria bacterium]|jgi:hypothetical protein